MLVLLAPIQDCVFWCLHVPKSEQLMGKTFSNQSTKSLFSLGNERIILVLGVV